MSEDDELFKRAAELPDTERAKFLDGLDDAQRSAIETRLSASFTPNPYPTPHDGENRPTPQFGMRKPAAAIPKSIGPYKILQPIGRGGMGQVFVADQHKPIKRRVALKVIDSETPTDQILARFEAERQALAMMDHQHIAKVLDAGRMDDGRPYFAMELVKGIPITEFCDEHRLTTEQRIEVFVQVCRAIEHAHQRGIIHRDLKPENVLVKLSDEQPVAKVIDFGLAKAINEHIQLTERTLYTHYGQIVGTLEYMSPEQAELNALDIDSRTDVYSLGVILFELLTGSTPIRHERLKSEAFDRILALIREEEPPRPSTRLSDSGEQIAGISQQRGTDPRSLSSSLRGDLDWITIKALEKDRTRRYASVGQLADDLERHLRADSVEARPPSMGYRISRSLRKHKTGVLVSGAALAVLILGGIVVANILSSARARHLQDRTEDSIRALRMARGPDVALAIASLEEFPEQTVLSQLQTEFTAAESPAAMPLAFGLAALGDVRTETLISFIESADDDEADNFVTALANSNSQATSDLQAAATRAERDSNWPLKARMAIIALHLDDPSIAAEMCRLRADPIQRESFIQECARWHGAASDVAGILRSNSDPMLRSAICLAWGRIDYEDLKAIDQAPSDLIAAMTELYTSAPAGATHSAAGWALNRWGRAVPSTLQPTRTALPGRDWFINSGGMTMLRIPRGTFAMTEDEDSEPRQVTLTKGFFMSNREISASEFESFRNDRGYHDRNYPGDDDELFKPLDEDAAPSDECPVQNVSWYGAQLFCNWLSEREQRESCYTFEVVDGDTTVVCDFQSNGYRLPTEAEWEYACRASSQTRYSFGDDAKQIVDFGYCMANSGHRSWPGAEKQPNGFGLFDMHGNIWEWCWDQYAPYDDGDVTDPTGPQRSSNDPTRVVMRGGGWWIEASDCASGFRESRRPDHQRDSIGFRVVCRD